MSPQLLRQSMLLFVIYITLLCCSTDAWAGRQYLVSPGSDWSNLADVFHPGDEIILMPGGVHRAVTLKQLHGTDAEPIIIRSLKPDEPVVVDTSRQGLILINARHVVVRDLVLEDINTIGIAVLGESENVEGAPGTTSSHVTLERIEFPSTGLDEPSFQLLVDHVAEVQVRGCAFADWRHIAMECVAVNTLHVEGCTFKGEPKRKPLMAMRVRGGSRNISVHKSLFESTGESCGICLGGHTEYDILAGQMGDRDADAWYEVAEASVEQCIFRDQVCPVLLAHAHHCRIEQNTIVSPKRWVAAMLSFHEAPAEGAARDIAEDERQPVPGPIVRPVFAGNLVVWESGAITGLMLVHPTCKEVQLVLDENLWWSDEPVTRRRSMIPTFSEFAVPQLVHVDPMLSEELRPTAVAAVHFGAFED